MKRYSPRLTRSGKAYGRISVYVSNDDIGPPGEDGDAAAATEPDSDNVLPEISELTTETPSSSVTELVYSPNKAASPDKPASGDAGAVSPENENLFQLVTSRRRTKKRRNSIFPRAAIHVAEVPDIADSADTVDTLRIEECPESQSGDNEIEEDALADVTVFVDNSEQDEDYQTKRGTIRTQMVMRNGRRKKVVVVEELDPTLLRPPPSSSCLKTNRADSAPAKNFRWADAKNEAPLCHLKVVELGQFTHNFRQSTKKQSMFGKVL